MDSSNIYRLIGLEIRENTARVSYSDDGNRLDICGAYAYIDADGLRELRRCNSAVYRGWEAGVNGAANADALERRAARAAARAAEIVRGWGRSPAGGWVEVDAETIASAGAVVLVCHDPDDVTRRLDLSGYFGRG